MALDEFVKSENELLEMAEAMLKIAKTRTLSVLRYRQVVYDSMFIDRGRKNINQCSLSSTYNEENIDDRVFSTVHGEEMFEFSIPQFEEWKRRSETPYIFNYKGIPLPSKRVVDVRTIPDNYEQWDDDFQSFTKEYKNERITREFGVEQQIIVNSTGGMVIESRPFIAIHYRQGYHPFMVSRSIGSYVSNNQDVNNLVALIRFLPDPTPDQRIRASNRMTDAFSRLYDVSNEVVYSDLDECGLSNDLTHDVIMLSGVPIHEIFGHQFEEPVYPLPVGQQSLFPAGKNVQNCNLILKDNPRQTIEGLEVLGSYHYDSYGRPSQEKVHIEDSLVKEYLGCEYVDQKNLKTYLGIDRSTSVGNARQSEEGFFPQARMSCTVLEGIEEEHIDSTNKIVMVPSNGYVLDGNFFKVMSSECYVANGSGEPKRLGPLEGSRAIYDAIIGMHILPGKSHHVGTCSKPSVVEEGYECEVAVSFFTNHQMWEHLTLRTI